jgi:arylsulfatase A-like enzyme/predicted Zn-dependent protease
VRDNGDFILGEDQVTLAERFKAAGYHTAAFTSAFPTQRRWGFNQGFDIYQDPLDDLPTQLDWRDERRAGEVVDDALRMLPELGEGPAFVWLHLFDAHWPYEPPAPWDNRMIGRPYDGEIAYAAAQVGRFLEWWDEAHPNSIVVITSDHGEGLGDGGEITHGFLLHDGTMRVPLILRGSGVPEGVVIDDAVGHVDIAPTLLRLTGLPLDDELQGKDLFEGGSELLYSEALTGQFNLGLAPLYAYTDDAGRYTEGGYGRWYGVYNDQVLTAADMDRDTTAEAEKLARFRATLDEVIAPEATLDAAALDQLAALGYLGGDTVAAAGEVDPRDVIDVLPLTWRARQAIGAGNLGQAERMVRRLEERMPDTYGVDLLKAQLTRARGRPQEAIELYTDLFFRSPSSTVALQLGGLYASIGENQEAADWFEETLALQPASPEAMAGLARTLFALGRTEEAEERANDYLVIYPDHAELMLIRAEMLLQDERAEEALVDASWALRQLPRNPSAYVVTATALWDLGRPDEALDLLSESLQIDRWNLTIRMRLAQWYLEVGRNAEAVRTIGPAKRLLPDNAEVQALAAEADAALAADLGRPAPAADTAAVPEGTP